MRIFVSYASQQEEWAKWIVWELENAKQRYQCLVQFRDFAPGTSFMTRMREGAESDFTVALFSPDYFQSKWCKQELDAGLAENRLLPVRVAKCDPGAFLRSRIYIDLVDVPLNSARQSLLSGVEAYVSQTRHGVSPRHVFSERPDFPGPLLASPKSGAKAELLVQPVQSLRVLFIAPEVGGLSPRSQLKEMEQSVSKIAGRGAIKFLPAFDARVNTLFEKLNLESPQVVHFSGKQNGGDILMRTEDGGLTAVSDMALAGMFKSLDRGIDLVIVDTCYSLRCATTISTIVPCTFGVEGDPYEDDTVLFYKQFYQAIAAGRSIKDAAAQGQTALEFAGVAQKCIPQLKCREDIDPSAVFLVQPPRRSKKRAIQ